MSYSTLLLRKFLVYYLAQYKLYFYFNLIQDEYYYLSMIYFHVKYAVFIILLGFIFLNFTCLLEYLSIHYQSVSQGQFKSIFTYLTEQTHNFSFSIMFQCQAHHFFLKRPMRIMKQVCYALGKDSTQYALMLHFSV